MVRNFAQVGCVVSFYTPAALPSGDEPPAPFTYEAQWDPEPVWTLWQRDKSDKSLASLHNHSTFPRSTSRDCSL